MRTSSGFASLLAMLVGFASAPAAADAPYREGEVLVRLRPARQRSAVAWARQAPGREIARSFRSIPGLHLVRLAPGTTVLDGVAASRRDRDVLYAEPNYIVEAVAVPDDPRFPELYGLGKIGAPSVWDVTTGDPSIVVAVIDTGIDYTHPDLAANVFENPLDCDGDGVDDDGNGWVDDCHGIDTINGDSDPIDDNAHGTHVSGTIGAVGNDGMGVVGVNWRVGLLGCKFLSFSGFGTTADAIACLDYVKAMKDSGVDIVATNNSWGGGGFSFALRDAIEAQLESDILFIASAGNTGADSDGSPFLPAGYLSPNVIAVAATDDRDLLAPFSNYGRRSVHLGAPGVGILSTVPGGAYLEFNGTSMASPHVAGAAALLHAADPSLDWRAIKNLLLTGGDVVAGSGDTISGRRLNVAGSLGCTGTTITARVRPRPDEVSVSLTSRVTLAAVNARCADPGGPVAVIVQPGGASVVLADDGVAPDQVAGDALYTADWSPPGTGTFVLGFPGGDVVTVHVPDNVIGNPTAGVQEHFGSAMAALGTEVVIGVPWGRAGAVPGGTAHRVDPVTKQVNETFVNPGGGAGDRFGAALAAAGFAVLVGAPGTDTGGLPNAGAAYLMDGATGALLRTLTSPVPSAGEGFGASVAVVGGNVLVGAVDDDPDPDLPRGPGKAYLFDPDSGALLRTFASPIGSPYPFGVDRFGRALLAVGHEVAVAAPLVLSVFVFDADPASGSFGTLRRTIDVPLGVSLGYVAGVLAVGDTFGGSVVQGIVHLVDWLTGAPRRILVSPVGRVLEGFGATLLPYGDDLLVGTPESLLYDQAGESVPFGPGLVFRYDVESGVVRQVLSKPASALGDAYGTSMATVGSRLLVGAPGDALGDVPGAGAAYVHDPSDVGPQKCYKTRLVGSHAYPNAALTDDLESKATRLRKPIRFCLSVGLDGMDVLDGALELSCHSIRDAFGQPRFERHEIQIVNRYGRQIIALRAAEALCVPGRRVPGVPSPALDAFKCYRAARGRGQRNFRKPNAGLADALETATFEVGNLRTYCTPVEVDGQPIRDRNLRLACYKITAAPGEARLTARDVTVSDRFGTEGRAFQRLDTVCIPSAHQAGAYRASGPQDVYPTVR